MSNMYSAKFMQEASANLKDLVFKNPVRETYLFSTLGLLREMNTNINKHTEKLYINISEASSKEDENKIFADYFYQFKSIFQDYANKLKEMKARMIISVENKVENWEELYKEDSYISNFDKELSYSGWEFSGMEDDHYPRLNLYKLYQKEFDYLGQLMQDNSIDASPSAKMKIIATVSNNFVNCSGDKNWIKELIHDMVDIDEKEVNGSYSECIYNALRDKHDFTINKSTLYTCKERLMDYNDVVEAASKMCDDLLHELEKVAENIASYLFRNQDKKLKIKTDTDGVIDRDYRLDTYSMNQLDLFLKNKINQIRKVLNVYSIAMSIKFDTVVDYVSQNIAILNMAKEYEINNADVNSDADEEDNEVIDSIEKGEELEDDSEDTENNTDDIDDDNLGTEPEDGLQTDKEAIEEDEDDSTDDLGELEDDMDEEDIDSSSDDLETIDEEPEELEEAYLFESLLFEVEMMQETYYMHENIKTALLLEEDQPAQSGGDNQPAQTPANNQQTSNTPNTQKLADKDAPNLWQKIVQKIIELWNKFKEAAIERTKQKIEYLKKNEAYIKKAVAIKSITLQYNADITALNSFAKIPDLNFQTMEQYLVDEKTFCTQYFREYYVEGKSIAEVIKEKYLGQEVTFNNTDSLKTKPTAIQAYEFCINYTTKADALKKDMDMIEKAQRVAKNVNNVQESAGFEQYFTEMKAEASGEKSKKLMVYFKVCSQVLAAEMTVYQKWFNELYNYCKWIIKQSGGKSDNEGQNNNQN